MTILDDVSGALALLSRTSHARLFAAGPFPPMALRLGVPKGFKIFTSIIVGNPVEPLTPRRKDRRSLDDAVCWL